MIQTEGEEAQMEMIEAEAQDNNVEELPEDENDFEDFEEPTDDFKIPAMPSKRSSTEQFQNVPCKSFA